MSMGGNAHASRVWKGMESVTCSGYNCILFGFVVPQECGVFYGIFVAAVLLYRGEVYLYITGILVFGFSLTGKAVFYCLQIFLRTGFYL